MEDKTAYEASSKHLDTSEASTKNLAHDWKRRPYRRQAVALMVVYVFVASV
jgi:hypothetical protein